jgi:AraC family transcriptional regulator
MRVNHDQVLAMLLRPGAVEMGRRKSELTRFTYDAGEMILASRHVETWARTDSVHYLSLAISDAALTAACDGNAGEIELRGTPKLVDSRVRALVAAVNAERIAGFPGGQLFLDSVEQALAVALISGHGVGDCSVRVYRGGLGAARLRRVTDLVHAEIEDELSLDKLAEAAGLSTAHFSQMFRKSTGESPHKFVLRHRVERQGDVAHSRWARTGCCRGLRVQDPAALCPGIPSTVRSEPYRISSGIPVTRKAFRVRA